MTITINASTSSGLITTPDNSGAIALQANGTTALNISSGGVVTTPLRPNFVTYLNTVQSIPNLTGTQVTFNVIDQNIGGGFNTSTGGYTVPVAGTYLLTSYLYIYSVTICELWFYKNSTRTNRVSAPGLTTNTNPNAVSATILMPNCAVGDVLSVQGYQNSGASASIYGTGARESVFSGFLL